MKSVLKFPLLILAGLFVLQAAWILSVPPFRASDEFDHVYRSAGVAEGEWRLHTDTAEGRGLLVTVPGDVVEAASAQCDYLPYPGPDNCFPVEVLDDGRVVVSTAAATYNPAYYFVLGQASRGFEGASVDYAMRVTSALLSCAGIAVAALCLSLGGAGRWAKFGFVAALSPVLVYTTIIPAPNAMEIVAGLCLWTSLWALLAAPPTPRRDLFYVGVATTAACIMATVRYIGPMWLGLIVLAVVFFAGLDAVLDAVRRAWRPLLLAASVVTVVLALGLWWTFAENLMGATEDRAEYGDSVSLDLGLQPIVWVLQMVAAFPLRADVAPPEVYALYVFPVAALVIAAISVARGRRRAAILTLTCLVLTLPVVLTLLSAQDHGIIWQGRYQLGFASGLLILGGAVLDRSGFAAREGGRLVLVGVGMFGLAHLRGILALLQAEREHPISSVDPSWPSPSWVVIATLVLAGFVCWALAVRSGDVRVASNPAEVRDE